MKMPPIHPLTSRQLEQAKRRPAHAYLFVGRAGIGKRAAAHSLALALTHAKSVNDPSIITLRAQNPDRPSIKLDQVHQMLAQLQLKTVTADAYRIVIIEQADAITAEAANALLKALEEPPAGTVFILLACSVGSMLPTIRSRLQTIRFLTPDPSSVRTLLRQVAEDERDQLLAAADQQPGALIALLDDAEKRARALTITARADDFITGGITARFAIAKHIHDAKSATEFLAVLYQKLNDLSARSLLFGAEVALKANLNPRLVLERLALELVP